MGNPVTLRQMEVHRAIVEHEGDEKAAARALGVSYQTVHKTEMAYLVNARESPVERPGKVRPPSPMDLLREIPAKLAAIETHLAYIGARLSDHAAAVESLSDRVAELNARQPLLLVERYTSHRRQSDGGAGGKAERGGR